MTFESLLAGPTFARCTFEEALRGTKLDHGRTARIYIYIYKEDFAQQYDNCGARSGSPQLFEALKLIRIIYIVLMQNRSCFTRKQTCNGKYTKHCTRTRHQLKMAAPAEASKRRSNFRIRQFKEKFHYNIAANLTFNTMVSFVTLLIARTARIACADRHTHTYIHTHTHKTTTVTLSAHARRGLMNVRL